MGRNKKGDVPPVEKPGVRERDAQLAEALGAVRKSGADNQVYYRIGRRVPGQNLWLYWKSGVAHDSIDDLTEFCYKEGGENCEYRAVLVDQNDRKIRDDKGEAMPVITIPAKAIGPNASASAAPSAKADDSLIKTREEMLANRAKLASIRAQELEIEKEERRLKRSERRDDDDDEEGEENFEREFQESKFPKKRGGRPWGPMFQPPYPPPWERPDAGRGREDRMFEMLMAQQQQTTQLMIAALQSNKPHDDGLSKILPLILAGQMKPQDMMGVMMPLMGEAMKLQGEGARSAMESMGEMQKSVFGQIVKAMLADGRPDDEIDKVKRIAGIVTDGLQEVTKTVLGRESIIKPGQEMKVPVVKQLQKPPTALQTPKPTPPPVSQQQPALNPGAATPETHPPPVPDDGVPAPDPVKFAAEEVVKNRIMAFLEGHEQEMLVESDPGLVADKLEELYLSLPSSLRNRIENLEVAEVYEEFRKRAPEVVARILAAVKEDEARIEWCEEFWSMIRSTEEEEEGTPEPAEAGNS